MTAAALLIALLGFLGGAGWLFYLHLSRGESRASLIGSWAFLALGVLATVVAVASSPSSP